MTDENAEQLYSTEDAAKYLGIAEVTVKYHVYQSLRLPKRLIGRTLVFTQQELDTFKAQNIPAHRSAGTVGGVDRNIAAAKLKDEGKTLKQIMAELGYKTEGGASRAVKYGRAKLEAQAKRPKKRAAKKKSKKAPA